MNTEYSKSPNGKLDISTTTITYPLSELTKMVQCESVDEETERTRRWTETKLVRTAQTVTTRVVRSRKITRGSDKEPQITGCTHVRLYGPQG